MKNVNKILVPVNLSESSANILRQAIHIADRCHAEIMLLHVYSRPLLTSHSEKEFERGLIHRLEREMLKWKERRIHARISALLKDVSNYYDIKFTILKERGLLTNKIKEVAKKYKVDLVIAGAKRRKSGADFWNAKIARLVKELDVPILTLPNNAEVKSPAAMAFAYDMKPIKNYADLDIIKIFASVYNTSIHIFSVYKDKYPTKEEMKNIESLKKYFIEYAPKVYMLNSNDVELGIMHYLRHHKVSLVSLLHRSRNTFREMFHKSIAKKITTLSEVPVLTIEDHRVVSWL